MTFEHTSRFLRAARGLLPAPQIDDGLYAADHVADHNQTLGPALDWLTPPFKTRRLPVVRQGRFAVIASYADDVLAAGTTLVAEPLLATTTAKAPNLTKVGGRAAGTTPNIG